MVAQATDLIYRFYERESEEAAPAQKTPLLRRSPCPRSRPRVRDGP